MHSGNVAGQRESGSQAGAARCASLAAIDDEVKAREPDSSLARTPYLCWKRRRLVSFFRTRTAAWPKLSWPATLAAARRARCVLADGCPVLSVHFSFGFARHIGQRTDNICRNVRSSGFTRTLFSIAHVRNGQSCSLGVSIRPKTGMYLEPISLHLPQTSWLTISRTISLHGGDISASRPASLAFRKRRRILLDLVLGNPTLRRTSLWFDFTKSGKGCSKALWACVTQSAQQSSVSRRTPVRTDHCALLSLGPNHPTSFDHRRVNQRLPRIEFCFHLVPRLPCLFH